MIDIVWIVIHSHIEGINEIGSFLVNKNMGSPKNTSTSTNNIDLVLVKLHILDY